MSCNPYLVVSVVDPRNLPDDIMEIVKNKVSNGRESIAELKEKIDKKVAELHKVRVGLVHGVEMLGILQTILTESEINGDEKMLDETKTKIELFEMGQATGKDDLEKLRAEIQELEQQVKDEPKMRDMHRELFQNNT